jgi:hypothetical protein
VQHLVGSIVVKLHANGQLNTVQDHDGHPENPNRQVFAQENLKEVMIFTIKISVYMLNSFIQK